jgi:hypothetical protein
MNIAGAAVLGLACPRLTPNYVESQILLSVT